MKNCTPFLVSEHPPGDKTFSTSKCKRIFSIFQKTFLSIVFLFSFIAFSSNVTAQLGVYSFTGAGACPNQNPAVTSQPANAVFSNYQSVGLLCQPANDVYNTRLWPNTTTFDPNIYNEFTITANVFFVLNLSNLSFTQFVNNPPVSGNTIWYLRSSIDNYATDIATGTATVAPQTPSINLPAIGFSNISSVTFRLYLTNIRNNVTQWINDDVTIMGTVNGSGPASPANPTSNSPQCTSPGVTMNFTGSPPVGQTWYWQTSATGTNTTNSASSNVVTVSGTYYVRAQDNTTLAWSSGAGSVTVIVTPVVTTPVFVLGATSNRCLGSGSIGIIYTATASNTTGITYSLDAASLAGGNTINTTNGEVFYTATWSGPSTITASAAGCGGPLTAVHTVVTITDFVTTPVFTLGATSTRCQGAGSVTYAANATYTTGITYSLDATTLSFGNTINAATGQVTYVANWNGSSTITASAAGCGGPLTADHEVTITPTVGTPAFTLGATSTRCQGAGSVLYDATATNATAIIYSLDAASLAAGNTIDASTGEVTYDAGWSGTSLITATAAGCNGPKTSNHTVTVTATVGTPVFTLGATSTRCQGAGTVTYTATASSSTSITYSLDAASITGGNTINSTTGAVTYVAGWSGTSTITSTAAGCNGPTTATHTVTITPTVGTPVFTLGATSIRCQGAGTVLYDATAANSTAITYTLNAASITGGNTINATTGLVTYAASWIGATIITASAAGCNGPKTATHTVTITPTVGTPVFTLGATTTRCQGSTTVTYTATATNSTSRTYSLDAASLTGSNTINATTGAVTYDAAWTGTSIITVTAAGCNGPSTATHTVTITPTVGTPVFTLGATSTHCQGAGTVTYAATAVNSTSINYNLDAASIAGGNSINSTTGAVTYVAGWSGTSTITSTAAGCNGPTTATHTVTITPFVGTPVFTLGATSTRCQGAGNVIYDATATNNTGITYTLNAASILGGNTINAATGAVTYAAGWSGTSTITATATGCNGPKTATHTVTITPSVGTPVFTSGAASTRCQGNASINYNASAVNNTALVWSIDAASIAAGNSINSGNGLLNYTAAWNGVTIITVIASGCNGPTTATHTATITPTVGTPVFTLGATSTRCQGAGTVLYDATAANNTSITYTLNAASLGGGNTINAATGLVTYAATWSGTTIITASAAGCNGPSTATHTVTITPTVSTPVFTLGATSTRCQGAGTVTYTATAANSTSRIYTLDAASLTGSNTINATTGAVTYNAAWSGTSIITVTAAGCNGPSTAIHTVTITPTVGTPVFTLGAASVRCQASAFVAYTATATNSTSITYSLDAASIAGGNTINSSTGVVVYAAGWTGLTTITASAAGCNGPVLGTHVVTTTPIVSTPVFILGSTSTRCQGANTVNYTANAANSTSITYSLNAASITAGNTINASTGDVTYVAGWNGSTIITASAAGCSGPKTANHTVTITPTVGTPVFAMGLQSLRTQGAATITYSATATNNTGITYSLDAASLSAGNTINTATGAVTYTAAWFGTSAITASAAGCNGPATAVHIVNANTIIAQTPLYLSTGQSLDRIDPVATNIIPTIVSYPISTTVTGISIDATSTNFGITGTITVPHTTGTGPYRLMLVGISQKNRTVTGVTYGATALTLVGENNINGNARIAIYKLVNPPSGTANVVVNFSTPPDKGAVVNVTTYTGVDQTTPLGTFATQQANSTNPTVNVTSAAGELVYDVVSIRNQPVTVTAGQTQRWNINSGSEITGAGSTEPGAATTTMNWTAASTDWSIGAVPIKPAGSQNTITFTQSPALCNNLIIDNQTIQVLAYVNITSGIMPVNPAITVSLKYGSTTIISLSNPVYNSFSNLLSWTGVLGADVTVPSGQAISLIFTSAQAAVEFQIEYHSASKPSRISLLPVSTFIDFISFDVYSAPYPGGIIRTSGLVNTTYYVRGKVTTPFGYRDITGMDLRINPPGNTFGINCVDSSTCNRTYEYAWTTPPTTNLYFLMATAKEGFENLIKNSDLLTFDVCAVCPPVALNDSATGAGASPLIIDVLANDNDPNNNIKLSTLAIMVQAANGTGFISNNKVVYLPNGSFSGRDTLTYRICDSTGLCATAQVFLTLNPFLVDPCSEATKSHVYYLPFSENEARMALDSSTNQAFPSNDIRTVISLKMPYPGMTIVWDEWEDGYELNALDPLQSTTKVWGDGNPYNGIVPGYTDDIIPAGGSIVLDNIIPTNPRVASNIFYDGRDKITSSGQIAMTQVCGEPSIMSVQCMKTNVSPVIDYGTSFTIPVGQNFLCQDFRYTSLFIRAAQNNTVIQIDKDNNGSLETTDTLNEGEVLHVNGSVFTGASIAASANIGVELHFGGNDNYSSRDVPVFPATWYSNTYYSPVPTTGRAANPADTNVVMLYNNLNRVLSINWSSGVPSSGVINLPAKSVIRFALPLSATAAYKFVNPTGESFTAIEISDSWTPGGGGNIGTNFDWAFNLIAESRLTDFATIAWAPGSIDGTRNDNPVWVTPTSNTTIYVKYDGNVSGSAGLLSPCGLRYDVSYALNTLNHRRILDPNDNDQSGLAVFTCNGAKLAAVYGEDASTALVGGPSWDVGSTIQPFCKQKLIFANDDYARTMVNQPVTIPILLNDFGFLAVVDPATVTNTALLQPKNGSVFINANGTVIYTPNTSYAGKDTFEYNVCSTPTPIVCDIATVYVDISVCPAPASQNVIAGTVFNDKNEDSINNDGGTGIAGARVYLYVDGNCNTVIDANELKDSVTVDGSGSYQFVTYPEKLVEDDFDGPGGVRTCANGSDGSAAWLTNWVDAGDAASVGYCNASATANCEILKDGAFTNGIRLKNANVSATRTVNLNGAGYAFLSFSYRRKSATLTAGENVLVQASSNGATFATIFTIAGTGTTDPAYVNIYNQDITQYASAATYIRFLTIANVDDADTVYIDNVKVQFIRYPICYITRLDPTTVPAYHHTTTVLQHSLSASSAQTCLAPFDFGITKNKITISGTLFKDANGLTDSLVNGTPMGAVSGTTMYGYLVDSTGLVVRRTTVNSATGNYTFPDADVFTNYTLRLSALSVNMGDPPPANSGISAISGYWVTTGDAYGTNNFAGTGIKSGAPSCSVPVSTTAVNVTNVNCAVERLPDSDDRSLFYSGNTPNIQYDVTGGLTGTDPEDGTLGSGKTYKITSLPYTAVLFYNGIAVSLNEVISSFNPALLKIDPDDDIVSTFFKYASMDAAGFFDPIPATITVTWYSSLPVDGLVAQVNLSGNIATVKWSTQSEQNTDHFVLERSLDNISFSAIGFHVTAAGNSTAKKDYQQPDNISSLTQQAIIYYRVKLVDMDGRFKYSNVVVLRLSQKPGVTIWPNPFTSSISVSITTTAETTIDISLIDVSGQTLRKSSQSVSRGITKITIDGLEQLPSGTYLVEINDKKSGVTYQKVIKNEK